VWHAWGEICDLYFPKVASGPDAVLWSVLREAYRGVAPVSPSSIKSDVVLVRIVGHCPSFPEPFMHRERRDYLWVECKAASHDRPPGWKELISGAFIRLHTAHPFRTIFVVFAIGWKYIVLVWAPLANASRPRLWIQSTTSNSRWSLDPRLSVSLPGPYHDQATGQIITEHAFTLDCFST
jgi:hypothetical protein